jgi:hypothetical protein
MSSESAAPGGRTTPTVTCRVCGTDVPLGVFCGFCGAHLFPHPGNGPDWLRIRAYAAAPGEHVLALSVVSSLFPHLPHRSRMAFRAGLAIVVVVLVVFALLRWQAPLIAVSALGFPLLFQFYLQECDVYGDLPVRTLLLTAALGAGLGVGWASLTGPVVAQSYNVAIGLGLASPAPRVLQDGLAIPLGGTVLMLVPVVLVRVLRPAVTESLDGFLIGSVGAIGYAAAATLTRLAPQFSTGLVARNRPVDSLLIEAGIRGIAMPLTAAAAGGLVGAALWITRKDSSQPQRPWYMRATFPAVVVVVSAVYAGLGLTDVARLAPGLQLFLHLLIATIAILALRIGLHLALLHETHDAILGEPLLCVHCHHIVPDMAFCPNCGVATRASSRSSRNARRASRPVPTDATAAPGDTPRESP